MGLTFELHPCVVVVAVASVVMALVELANLVLVNNNPGFKRVVADIERMALELEKLALTNANKKRERQLETQLTLATRNLYMARFKGLAVLALAYGGTMYYLKELYGGKVAATLPFEPMFPFTKVARNYLPTDPAPAADACGFMFLLVLTNMAVRPNLAKLLGTQLPPAVAKATDFQTMTSRFSKITGVGQLSS